MPLKARIAVRISCTHCAEHYDVALGLSTLGVLIVKQVLPPWAIPGYMPPVLGQMPAPEGWVVDDEAAYCPAHAPPPRGVEIATPEIVKRAEALWGLSRDGSTTDGERRNAKVGLEKLWRKYWLPDHLSPG